MIILVTAIGSFSADCVIRALKAEGHRVIGCDIYPAAWHAVSKDCDVVYQVPLALDKEAYTETLLRICKHEHVNCVFPLTDVEIDVLNDYREAFIISGVLLCIQSKECLLIARDKFELSNTFKDSCFINVPKTVLADSLIEGLTLPAIAKPINGRSSEGIQKICTVQQLKEIPKTSRYIVQEYLDGSIFTVDYVRDTKGNDFSVPRKELLRTKNGAGITVEIEPNAGLQQISSYIGERIGVVGCINMEFILHKNEFYLIDINPRFSAGVAFSNLVGFNMVTSHLSCFYNGVIEKNVVLRKQIITKRYYEEVLG